MEFMFLVTLFIVCFEINSNCDFYLYVENSQQMFIWVGRNSSPELLSELFGVDRPEAIDIKMV
jgi:hypothetical protein